ncbi:DNA repair protein rhp55 [Paramyrothecium foliicola]|nr:DNA repair protein rhp55 [Paramyrothecium foliicola]
MDYHAVHGHDIASFSTSETHRLPTVSASQALNGLASQPLNHISSGLGDLDKILRNTAIPELEGSFSSAGIRRGQVTDIWGPPGTGKTALGVQIVANAICDGHSVIWVGSLQYLDTSCTLRELRAITADCFQAAPTKRIASVLKTVRESRQKQDEVGLQEPNPDNFAHYRCLTLAHLMALIARPTKDSLREGVSLIVISSLTALVNSSLPKAHDSKPSNRPAKGLTATAKRLQVLQYIITALQKLAATRQCAVVLLSQCATRMQSERSATLVPAVNATVWELGVSTRLAIHKDWIWQDGRLRSASMVRVQKLDGKAVDDSPSYISAFNVENAGITSIKYEPGESSLSGARIAAQKRKLEQTGLEVADSEDDEDYEWGDEDESAISPPPRRQWQGSEDVLLGLDVGQSDAGTESDDADEDEEPHNIVGDEAQSKAEAGLSAGEAPRPKAAHPR